MIPTDFFIIKRLISSIIRFAMKELTLRYVTSILCMSLRNDIIKLYS